MLAENLRSLYVRACTNSALYEAIDQPSVRAIVNPGGTNERFIDAKLRRAKKILHQDNRTIFNEIINGNADLMITDSIEVRLQANLHPELCGSMPGETLTYQEKGYMMPKDPVAQTRSQPMA